MSEPNEGPAKKVSFAPWKSPPASPDVPHTDNSPAQDASLILAPETPVVELPELSIAPEHPVVDNDVSQNAEVELSVHAASTSQAANSIDQIVSHRRLDRTAEDIQATKDKYSPFTPTTPRFDFSPYINRIRSAFSSTKTNLKEKLSDYRRSKLLNSFKSERSTYFSSNKSAVSYIGALALTSYIALSISATSKQSMASTTASDPIEPLANNTSPLTPTAPTTPSTESGTAPVPGQSEPKPAEPAKPNPIMLADNIVLDVERLEKYTNKQLHSVVAKRGITGLYEALFGKKEGNIYKTPEMTALSKALNTDIFVKRGSKGDLNNDGIKDVLAKKDVSALISTLKPELPKPTAPAVQSTILERKAKSELAYSTKPSPVLKFDKQMFAEKFGIKANTARLLEAVVGSSPSHSYSSVRSAALYSVVEYGCAINGQKTLSNGKVRLSYDKDAVSALANAYSITEKYAKSLIRKEALAKTSVEAA